MTFRYKRHWHPFNDEFGEKSIDTIADELELQNVQRRLLRWLLRSIELTLYYTIVDVPECHIEVHIDWHDYHHDLAAINLETLLQACIDDNDSGVSRNDKVIALRKLQAIINDAIEHARDDDDD